MGFPGGSDNKESACNAGDLGSIPWLGLSPGGEHGNPLQYSYLDNPHDRGAWWLQSMGSQRVRYNGATKAQHSTDIIQIRSVPQSCPTLCDPMNCNTPGLPVHHQLPEFTQTHIHRVSDAMQPSCPRLSPSPPAPNPSQHQSLFQ